jgi:DNA helicase-2/ATP-dependent DNA helicase PcrA
VDEYQDTNDLQEKFIKNLVHKHNNLMVVGDDDQAIYGWRGSNVKLITTFSDRWDSDVIRLGHNYRCRAEIVECAAASITHNEDRVTKDLWGARGYGGTVESRGFYWQDDEVRGIAAQIKDQIDSGCSPRDVAVLARRRRWVSMMHNELINLGVPSDAVGVKAWYERDDVRLLLSFIRSVTNRSDIDAAQQVLASWPSIGAGTIQKWYGAIKHGDDVYDGPLKGLLSLPRHGRKTKKGQSIERLVQLVSAATDHLMMGCSVYDLLVMLHARMGISGEVKALKDGNIKDNAEAEYRSEGIKLLLGAAIEISTNGFDAVNDLSDEVSTLISAQSIGSDAVTVSTIHSAKGLEWEKVFVIGCSHGILPSGDNIEEERRLFYVAATRARENLTITHSINVRGIDGKTHATRRSLFVDEAMVAVVEEF